MKFVYQVGLALLVNIAIISGEILPGVAVPIGPGEANSEKKEEPRVLIAEVVLEGVPENLKEIVLKAIITKAGAVTTKSQLQKDINSIFKTGWFNSVSAVPSDTPKGVRVTFKIIPNPILRQIIVKPKDNKIFIPESVVNETFSTQYGKITSYIALQDGIAKLLRWCRQKDRNCALLQLNMPTNISNNGIINLEFSQLFSNWNFTATYEMSVLDYISLGKSLEEIGKLDDALAVYKKASTLLEPDSYTSGSSKIIDNETQGQEKPFFTITANYYQESAQRDRANAYRMIGNVQKKTTIF
jgi:Surface antigen variable number repeat